MSLNVFDDASRTISASLRISQIMTPAPSLSCLTTRDGEKAKQLSLDTNYDIIPISQNGVISSYFHRATGKIERVQVADLLSSESTIDDCLELFRDREFYFVNRENRVVGLVNHADLDKVPVRLSFYVLISKLETLLLAMFRFHYRDDDSWKGLLRDRVSKIADIYEAKKRRGLDISLFDCMNLSDMLELLQKSEKLYEFIGFESRKKCEKACSGLDELRHDVMHTANPTLLARGVPNLLDRRQRLIQLIRTCEEAMRKTGLN